MEKWLVKFYSFLTRLGLTMIKGVMFLLEEIGAKYNKSRGQMQFYIRFV